MLLLSHWILQRHTKRAVRNCFFSIFNLNFHRIPTHLPSTPRTRSYSAVYCSWFYDKSFSIQQEFWRWSINMTCTIHSSKFEYWAFHDRSIQRLSLLYIARASSWSSPRPYSYISVNASFQLQKIMHYFRSLPGLMAARRGEYTNMFFPSGLVSHPRRNQNPGAWDLSGSEGCFPHPEKFPPLTASRFMRQI